MCVYSGIVPKELGLIPSKERSRRVQCCWCSEPGNLHASTFPACYSLSPFHARLGSSLLSWGELPLAAGLLCVCFVSKARHRSTELGNQEVSALCSHYTTPVFPRGECSMLLPKTAAPSCLVLNLPLEIDSIHPCTDPVVGSHTGVVSLDHSVLLMQNEYGTTWDVLRMISVPSGISVGQ